MSPAAYEQTLGQEMRSGLPVSIAKQGLLASGFEAGAMKKFAIRQAWKCSSMEMIYSPNAALE